jgi:hypothetical protein
MNAKMVDYLRNKHNGRSISGIKENKTMKYNFENLSPDEKTQLEEYISSVKEIQKEIKKLVKKAKVSQMKETGGNMSKGLNLEDE